MGEGIFQVDLLDIFDRAKLKLYPAEHGLVEAHGGRTLAATGRVTVLAGNWPSGRLAVLKQWPEAGAFWAYYRSAEYAQLRELRLQCARGSIVLLAARSETPAAFYDLALGPAVEPPGPWLASGPPVVVVEGTWDAPVWVLGWPNAQAADSPACRAWLGTVPDAVCIRVSAGQRGGNAPSQG